MKAQIFEEVELFSHEENGLFTRMTTNNEIRIRFDTKQDEKFYYELIDLLVKYGAATKEPLLQNQ